MWSNFLFILELVVLYGVPLLESLDALKKESDSSKIKKWAAFWAIQIGINAISPLFWFLSG